MNWVFVAAPFVGALMFYGGWAAAMTWDQRLRKDGKDLVCKNCGGVVAHYRDDLSYLDGTFRDMP
jgi:hypothetical protein